MCVRLSNWPIDRLLRRRPALSGRPLVLVSDRKNRREVTALSSEAETFGIKPGMTLAQARALCAHLISLEHDFARDEKALEALGYWMMRFTPIVQVERGQRSEVRGQHGLFLDLTGCERFFMGMERIQRLIASSLRRLRIQAILAIAPTPGAAWALSCSTGFQPVRGASGTTKSDFSKSKVVVHGLEARATVELLGLPPITLRIDPEIAESLHHLGIETIGQLIEMPRELLPARFGDQLIRRMDELTGKIPEPLVPLPARYAIKVEVESDFPIHSLEAIYLIFRKLLERLIAQMDQRGVGAREIELIFKQHYAPTLRKTIEFTRATRNAAEIFNLLKCAQEKMPSDVGIRGVCLNVKRWQRIDAEQICIMGDEEFAGQQELDRLIERLCVKLGTDKVGMAELIESYLPEKSWRFIKETQMNTDEHGLEKDKFNPRSSVSICVSDSRPLRVFDPIEIPVMVAPHEDREGKPILFRHGEVKHVRHAVGPERICGPWWEGRNKTRDYYDVEDQQGKRWWIFRVRETNRWYLHGSFE